MSILGAMNTAVSGLAAQSAAFGNISENVANAQTVGFKGINTTFADYLTTSSTTVNDPGTVVASPQYLNTVQGTITQSTNPLALAISGQGFFDVSQATGTSTSGQTLFANQPYFTRDGDFQVNNAGYLTNDAGQYLNGYVTNSSGVIDKSAVVPIQVSQTVYQPVATQNMTMTANLPSGYHLGLSPTGQTEILDSTNTVQQAPSSQVNVYDSEGNPHQVTLTWYPTATSATQTPPAPWMLSIADTTNGGNIPIMGAANLAADQKILAVAGTALNAANTTLTTTSNTLTADQATQTTAQYTLTSDLTANATALSPVSADITAVQTARAAVATAAPTMNSDKAALAAVAPGLMSAVTTVETARAAVTKAQAQVYSDQLTNATVPAADATALTNAQTALTTAYTTFTTAATTADSAQPTLGILVAATQLVTDWQNIDTANATVATAMGTLGTDVQTATAAGNTTVTPAATTIVTDWNAIDTASDSVAADQTNVASAQAAVTTTQAAVTKAQTTALADGGPVVTYSTDGTLKSLSYISPATGKPLTIAATAAKPNPLAELTFEAPYATATSQTQPITLNLGNIGETNGVTQFAGSSYTLRGLNQDGVPPGSFTGISTQASGDIYANYDNGQTRLVAQVPLATFGNANALQSQNGSAYTVTLGSGDPSLQDAGTNGAGALLTSSVESSNVDIASEFTQLIVAQQAYTANTKVVTTADQLMQATINMKT